jgi:hypothetical protein
MHKDHGSVHFSEPEDRKLFKLLLWNVKQKGLLRKSDSPFNFDRLFEIITIPCFGIK